jgi:hypothetical protein
MAVFVFVCFDFALIERYGYYVVFCTTLLLIGFQLQYFQYILQPYFSF